MDQANLKTVSRQNDLKLSMLADPEGKSISDMFSSCLGQEKDAQANLQNQIIGSDEKDEEPGMSDSSLLYFDK